MDMRGNQAPTNPDFPFAPSGWSLAEAEKAATADGLMAGAGHWEVVRALQEFFVRHEDDPMFHARELLDALDEKFHARGGLKFLYQLFPGGPIAQGCRIAGLEPPPGSVDRGFGSVQ